MGGKDTPTSLVVERPCALHVSAADSATWVGYHKEYLLIGVIRSFATCITLWNVGDRHSLRPRIRQQGKIRIHVDRSMYAFLCTSTGRRVWVGCLPESECLLQSLTVQGSSLARKGEERESWKRGALAEYAVRAKRAEMSRAASLLSHSCLSRENASRSASSSFPVILCHLFSDNCAHAYVIIPHVLYARAGMLQYFHYFIIIIFFIIFLGNYGQKGL